MIIFRFCKFENMFTVPPNKKNKTQFQNLCEGTFSHSRAPTSEHGYLQLAFFSLCIECMQPEPQLSMYSRATSVCNVTFPNISYYMGNSWQLRSCKNTRLHPHSNRQTQSSHASLKKPSSAASGMGVTRLSAALHVNIFPPLKLFPCCTLWWLLLNSNCFRKYDHHGSGAS